MFSNTYDYTAYALRTDPSCPLPAAEAVELLATTPQLGNTLDGTFLGTMPVIANIWSQFGPDHTALLEMIRVAMDFVETTVEQGIIRWADVPSSAVSDFVTEEHPQINDEVRRLRKNTVHACYLALTDAGLHHGDSPAAGIDPIPDTVRTDERGQRRGNPKEKKVRRGYNDRVHVRPATHDEVILTRLATRLAGTTRSTHLSAAAVALCSTTATTHEAPQVTWADVTDETVSFVGRAVAPGREETHIAARTRPLDRWAAQSLADWRAERSAVRPVHPDSSVLYSGQQALTSDSAQISADQQVRKAFQIADLNREAGLTAGSLRMWAAARLVTDFPSLADGAEAAGVDPLTLHRQVTQQGERGLRLSS